MKISDDLLKIYHIRARTATFARHRNAWTVFGGVCYTGTKEGRRAVHLLITNDDGIQAEGLWALAGELRQLGRVTVVAPERERSAIGTAVTLFAPLHAQGNASP